MDSRLHPRLKLSHRAPDFGETASNHDFEVVIGGAIRERRNPRENVARGQPYGDAVRVVDDDRIIDSKAASGGRGPCGLNGVPDF
jgi:hypothetical protein